MRLLRFEENRTPRLGALSDDGVIVLAALRGAHPEMRAIVAAGDLALTRVADAIAARRDVRPLESLRLLAPIERPGKYLAVGMNYGMHLEVADRLGVARSAHRLGSTSRPPASPAPSTTSTRA